VRDSKDRSLGEAAHPYVYQHLLQSYDPKMTLVVRTAGEPQAITRARCKPACSRRKDFA
jgi:hypothetical protein